MPPTTPVATTDYNTIEVKPPEGQGFLRTKFTFSIPETKLQEAAKPSDKTYVFETLFSENMAQTIHAYNYGNATGSHEADLIEILATSSSRSLNDQEKHELVSAAIQNNIKPKLLREHVLRAKEYMNVDSVEFLIVKDTVEAPYSNFYIRFKVNRATLSRLAQFNNYIDNYLNNFDINKTNIHISVI